jgi:hypothetical protein
MPDASTAHQDRDKAASSRGLRLLYLTGPDSAVDRSTLQQLERVAGDVRIATVDNQRAAVAQIQGAKANGRYHAVFTSPALTEAETLSAIAALRSDRAIAIVPVVTEAHRQLCTEAAAHGADAVLLQVGGTLVYPEETFKRIRHRRHRAGQPEAPAPVEPDVPATTGRGAKRRVLVELRKIQHFFSGGKRAPKSGEGPDGAAEKDRARLEARLNEALAARVRSESTLEQSRQALSPEPEHAEEEPPPHPLRRPQRRRRDHHADAPAKAGLDGVFDQPIASPKEPQPALDAHQAGETAWSETKEKLERQLEELQAALGAKAGVEEAAEAARKELQQSLERQEAGRNAWEGDRASLEERLARAEASARAAAERETSLVSTRRELEQNQAQYAAARAEWDAARRQLEDRMSELEAAAAELEAALAAARAGLKEAAERQAAEAQAHATDRKEWGIARQQLEQTLRDTEAAEQERQSLSAALLEARSEHTRLAAAQRMLEAELGDATNRAEQLTKELVALRSGLQAAAAAGIPPGLRERLRRARRVEKLGRKAAAMAPDLDTLILLIDADGTRLLDQLGHSDAHREIVESMLAKSAEARAMLDELVIIGRKYAGPGPTVDVNEAIQLAEPELTQLCRGRIDFNVRLGRPCTASVSADDLEQLLIAFVSSACELLNPGGSLLLETSVVDAGPVTGRREEDRQCDVETGPRCHVTVTASGDGVRSAALSPTLESAARRCGSSVEVGGQDGHTAVFQAWLPLAALGDTRPLGRL